LPFLESVACVSTLAIIHEFYLLGIQDPPFVYYLSHKWIFK
jgi:hypothetical protein